MWTIPPVHPQGQFNFGMAPMSFPTVAAAMPLTAALHSSAPARNIGDSMSRIEAGKAAIGPLEVSYAVDSLYADRVKPHGRILRKRIAEQAVRLGLGDVEVSEVALRQACEGCSWLSVVDEAAGEWVCFVKDRAPIFVDATDPQDWYPQDLWLKFGGYLDNLAAAADNAQAKLPGGRYACAQELQGRQLPFFQDRSLGEICHIVQLGISQKRLLGYMDGGLVPYQLSATKKKHESATLQRAVQPRAKWPVASIEEAVQIMLLEMQKARLENPHEPTIALSNIKRIFRGGYKKELSETALGYDKLSTLFQANERFRSICSVELRESGYVVTPPKPEAPVPTHPVTLFAGCAMPASYNSAATMPAGAPMCPPPPMPAPGVPHPGYSPQPSMAFPPTYPCYGTVPGPVQVAREVQLVQTSVPEDAPEFGIGATPEASEVGDDAPLQSAESSPASTSKSNWKRPSLGELGAEGAQDAFPDVCMAPPTVGKRPAFLRFGGAHPLSPSQLGKEGGIGSVIKGTFINFPGPPPSPAHGTLSSGTARIRARSLPKDIGSPKSDFEVACHSLSYQTKPVSTPGSEGQSPTRNLTNLLTLATLRESLISEDEVGAVTRSTQPKRHSDPVLPKTDLRLSELL